jgi:5-methylcytosine-specific restriction endonuclease McrA
MLFHHKDGGGNQVLANLFFLLEACHLRTIPEHKGKAMPPSSEELMIA